MASDGRPLALTGIKPTGTPHLGNWLGMIRPALRLADDYELALFVADEHALTSLRDPEALRTHTRESAATLLAFGAEAERMLVYRQSDVPETFELAWLLSCVTPKGLLNRAHAYKAAVAENEDAGRDADQGVNAGLFGYPVLMAADILVVHADAVPVGADQRQHVEIARDVAERFNRAFTDVLRVPETLVDPAVATIPGLDGRKMSKSYGNTIPCFAPREELRRLVFRIVTDPTPADAPKDPEGCNVFAVYRAVATQGQTDEMRRAYRDGISYAEAKERLFAVLDRELSGPRGRYAELMSDASLVEAALRTGADRARQRARQTLGHVRHAVGVGAM